MRSLPAASVAILWLLSPLAPAQAPNSGPALAQMAGCTLQGRTYTCSKSDLQHALSLAKTIRTSSQPPNHASDAALAELVQKLGKSMVSAGSAPSETPADLAIELEPIEDAGVKYGPATIDLARLRVSIATPDGSQGKLLWVETYKGDPSAPWPLVTRATAQQFRDHLKQK